jgi:hypothetical protein
MSVELSGFVGNSYELNSLYAGIERTVNWYFDPVEAPEEQKSRALLTPSPANFAFGPLPETFPLPARGRFSYRGNCYGVNGSVLFQLNTNAPSTQIGTVVDDGHPVSFCGNGNGQLCCASGGNLYVWDGTTFTTVTADPVNGPFFGAGTITFQDGYVIASIPNSNKFQISGTDSVPIGDATQWDAANVSVQAGQIGNVTAVISNQEYVFVICENRTLVYNNTGGTFPFQIYNDLFLEIGSASPYSITSFGALANDTVAMVSQTISGNAQAWCIRGLTPERISTLAVEQFWSEYPTVSDARAFTYQWNGHVFWQITFPSANDGRGATWVYDRTVSLLTGRSCWHERTYTDYNGTQWARSEQYHCFWAGKHVVGSVGLDGLPGATYYYNAPNDGVTPFWDIGVVDESGNIGNVPIIRDRIAPHLWGENKRRIYDSIEFEGSRGCGLAGDGPGSNPVIQLRWSSDYGNTFGPEIDIAMGKSGNYLNRMITRRTGRARDRVYWVRVADPVYASFSNAVLELRPLSV